MGRFETSAEFYRFREPYPVAFFDAVAERVGLSKKTRMLDVGCGPGNLAIGFAGHVGSCVGIDPEVEMLRVARELAAEAGAEITFVQTVVEKLDCAGGSFDFVTIGRALHWLDKTATLLVLERVVADGGCVAICNSAPSESPVNAWAAKFRELRRAWSADPDESRYRIDSDAWFAGSPFVKRDEVAVTQRHSLRMEELIGRGLSFSVTSPAALGARRAQFEFALRNALEPFAVNGVLEEEVVARASLFCC